ncbi:MAG: hypothetical protein H6772_02840 [Pseudomonadales bacterium]|nr:hypothetical protein [Pseudomonadales bacterium]
MRKIDVNTGNGEIDIGLSHSDLISRHINPGRFQEWISKLSPSANDLGLVKRLILAVNYLSEREIKEMMEKRWEEILKLAGGDNIYWSTVAREYYPSGEIVEGNKKWEPSGFQVTKMFLEFLMRKGFKEYNPENDPLYPDFLKDDYLVKQIKDMGPFVLSKLPALLIDKGKYRVNVDFLYKDENYASRYWYKRGFPPILFLLERGKQRIALTCEFRQINQLAVYRFLLRSGLPPNEQDKIGAVVFGDDWTLGGTDKSNAVRHIDDAYQIAYGLVDNKTNIVFCYGYATQQATDNLEKKIEEIRARLQNKNYKKLTLSEKNFHILHKEDDGWEIPVISDIFDENEIRRLMLMVRDKFGDDDKEFLLKKLGRAVLTHSALSVPDNMPNLITLGSDLQNKYPLLVHPKKIDSKQ